MKKRVRIDTWAIRNPEKHRARVAAWRAANPEKVSAINKANHAKNKDARNAAAIEYRATNLDHMRELGRNWAKDNAAKMQQTNAQRRAAKRQAIPKWAHDEFDQLVVTEIYDLAQRRTKSTGLEWHVDHIVPLRSKTVCGLHCAANLRLIPSADNHSKGNRVWPHMPT